MPCACPRPGEDLASASGRGQAQGIVPTHATVCETCRFPVCKNVGCTQRKHSLR